MRIPKITGLAFASIFLFAGAVRSATIEVIYNDRAAKNPAAKVDGELISDTAAGLGWRRRYGV